MALSGDVEMSRPFNVWSTSFSPRWWRNRARRSTLPAFRGAKQVHSSLSPNGTGTTDTSCRLEVGWPEGCGHARSCGLRALWNARRGAIRRCPRVGSHGQVVPCPDSSPEASPERVRASTPLPTIPWPSPKSADVLVPPPDTDSERPPDWAGQPNRLGVRLTDSGGDE